MELQVEQNREEISRQRHDKHTYLNQITAMRAALSMVIPLAKGCSCGTMDPLLPVLERLATQPREST